MGQKAAIDSQGRLLPTGECWCGCEQPTKEAGNFFLPGHDKIGESAVVVLRYGSVAKLMVEHGFGPGGENARQALNEYRRKGGQTR